MKKSMILSVMLMAAFAANAQFKVAPKMAKGTEKIYTTVTTTNIPGQGEMKTTSESKYTVAEATADGYILNIVVTDVKTEAAADNIAGRLMAASEEMVKGLVFSVATDKDGKVVKIQNFDELQPKMEKMAYETTDKLLKEIPMLRETMTKDQLKAQIAGSITEDNFLHAIQSTTSVLALNGKTVTTGAHDEFVNEQNMKLKRMYFVNGKNVTTNSSMNMSKDEMKAFVIKQVESTAPEQAETVKQNIDQVLDSGMLKFDVKETATYEFGDDNWVKNLKVESTMETMGQKVTNNTVMAVK